jgi:hypothetical protein
MMKKKKLWTSRKRFVGKQSVNIASIQHKNMFELYVIYLLSFCGKFSHD